MAEPEQKQWWDDGAELSADPATLSGYGENVGIIAKNFQQDIIGPAMQIRGGGPAIAISTGMYPEGTKCQGVLDRNTAEFLQFFPDGYQSMVSLDSCARVIGDVLKHTDLTGAALAAAVQWGFAMPGADRPKGLPSTIDGSTVAGETDETTVKAAIENPAGDTLISHHQAGGTWFYTFLTAAGTIRSVVQGPNGYTETAYAKDGTTKVRETKGEGQRVDPTALRVTDAAGGTITTTRYAKDGKTVEGTTVQQVVQTTPSVTSGLYYEDRITQDYDAKGEPTSSTVTHITTESQNDGTFTHDYYTEKTDDKGKSTVTEQGYVTPQPNAVTPQDYAQLADERAKELAKQAEEMK